MNEIVEDTPDNIVEQYVKPKKNTFKTEKTAVRGFNQNDVNTSPPKSGKISYLFKVSYLF